MGSYLGTNMLHNHNLGWGGGGAGTDGHGQEVDAHRYGPVFFPNL